jgi:CHAD domain-containing protein
VEWQLDALDLRPVERFMAGFPRTVPGDSPDATFVVSAVSQPVKRTVDIYLDTEDWRIGRAGFVLRVRHHAEQGEVTLKDTTPAVAGLRRRIEVTEPLPAAGIHALDAQGPVGSRLRALAGGAPLAHLLEIRTRRRPYLLQADKETLAEVDLDDTIIVVGDDEYPVRMRRVEVEANSRWVDRLTPLVDRLRRECSLQPALLSKFEVGLLAAGLQVPGPPDLGPTTLPSAPSIGDLAFTVMRRNLASMLAHEAGTRLGEDIEELHDMRVATRRLRAALALFEDVVPNDGRRLAVEMGWLAGELGAVRDLDVQRQRLDEWQGDLPEDEGGALDDLARLLERERDIARANMLSGLDSRRYEQLVADFSSMLRLGPAQGSGRRSNAARTPAAAAVPALILDRHRSAAKAARKAAQSRAADDYHRLRIRCKRFRYALEFVSEIYDGKTRAMVRQIVRLQDSLGIMQDAQVAATRLRSLAATETSLSPATVFVMGGVAERYRREADRLIGTLPGHLEAMNGERWRKLKVLMKHRRRRVGPPSTWSTTSPAPTDPATNDTPKTPDTPAIAAAQRSEPSSAPRQQDLHPDTPDSADTVAEDDPDWDDDYPPALRSVPTTPLSAKDPGRSSDDPVFQDEPTFTDAPSPSSTRDPGGRRRKEPVFLPAPAPPPRQGPVRSVPPVQPPEEDRSRSFHDRP